MKKLVFVLLLFLCLCGCSNKNIDKSGVIIYNLDFYKGIRNSDFSKYDFFDYKGVEYNIYDDENLVRINKDNWDYSILTGIEDNIIDYLDIVNINNDIVDNRFKINNKLNDILNRTRKGDSNRVVVEFKDDNDIYLELSKKRNDLFNINGIIDNLDSESNIEALGIKKEYDDKLMNERMKLYDKYKVDDIVSNLPFIVFRVNRSEVFELCSYDSIISIDSYEDNIAVNY